MTTRSDAQRYDHARARRMRMMLALFRGASRITLRERADAPPFAIIARGRRGWSVEAQSERATPSALWSAHELVTALHAEWELEVERMEVLSHG